MIDLYRLMYLHIHMYAYSHIDLVHTHTHASSCSVSLEDMPPMLKALESSTIKKKIPVQPSVFPVYLTTKPFSYNTYDYLKYSLGRGFSQDLTLARADL